MENKVGYIKFRWFVLVTMIIVTASTSLIMIAPSAIPSTIADGLDTSVALVLTITMSTFNLSLAIAATVGGPLIDKLGVGKIYIYCLLMIICGNLFIFFFATNTEFLFVGRLLEGLGTGPIMATAPLLAARWFKPSEHGIVTGMQGFAVSLGITIAFLILPFLLREMGNWRLVFAVLSAVNIIGIILTIFVMVGPKPKAKLIPQVEVSKSSQVTKFSVRQPLVIVCALALFFGSWIQQGVNTMGADYFGREIGLGTVQGSLDMSWYSVAFMVGSPLAGILLGTVFNKFKDNDRIVMGMGFIVSAITCLLLIWVSEGEMIGVILVITGLFQAFINPMVSSFIAKTFPETVIGRVTGFAMGVGFLAGVLVPMVCSGILSATGSHKGSFYILSLVSIFGMVVSLLLKNNKGEKVL